VFRAACSGRAAFRATRSGRAAFRAATTAASLLAGAAALSAHDFWLEPSTFTPSPNQVVSVRLLVGQRFRGEPIPRTATLIDRFVAVTAAGEAPVPGREGGDPAGLLRVAAPGLAILGYASRNSSVSLEAEKFEKYLAEEGLERVSAERRKRGETGKAARESFARCAKALISVGGGDGPDRALGFRLELVAENSPYATPSPASLTIRLLFEGRPLAGALVTAFPYDAPEAARSARTDASGRATVDISRRGQWLIKAVHMIPSGTPDADWQSLWASLTFRAGGPAPVEKTP
jgi:uncharacterized GH25 family protein